MYEKSSGLNLLSFSDPNYEGSFFLGSSTKHDTFKEVRVVLRIDTLFYEQSYLTKDTDDRTKNEELEKQALTYQYLQG